ncbi:MAG TPA: benenodin family lasso peptide [Sphingomonadaceae bacterium]|nr:benenodin family lasso peptide [Sphingomonadaceae bacterium]
MERELNDAAELIDLGIASQTTKGAWGIYMDEILTQDKTGLADD